jgi:hypothetical protein
MNYKQQVKEQGEKSHRRYTQSQKKHYRTYNSDPSYGERWVSRGPVRPRTQRPVLVEGKMAKANSSTVAKVKKPGFLRRLFGGSRGER